MIILSRIYGYSTVSTSEEVYIIGGVYTRKIVAEFKNYVWFHTSTLIGGRAFHGSIELENGILIVGGYPFDSRLVFL